MGLVAPRGRLPWKGIGRRVRFQDRLPQRFGPDDHRLKQWRITSHRKSLSDPGIFA